MHQAQGGVFTWTTWLLLVVDRFREVTPHQLPLTSVLDLGGNTTVVVNVPWQGGTRSHILMTEDIQPFGLTQLELLDNSETHSRETQHPARVYDRIGTSSGGVFLEHKNSSGSLCCMPQSQTTSVYKSSTGSAGTALGYFIHGLEQDDSLGLSFLVSSRPCPRFNRLTQSFYLDNVQIRRLFKKWNLSVVLLAFLAEPYETLAKLLCSKSHGKLFFTWPWPQRPEFKPWITQDSLTLMTGVLSLSNLSRIWWQKNSLLLWYSGSRQFLIPAWELLTFGSSPLPQSYLEVIIIGYKFSQEA